MTDQDAKGMLYIVATPIGNQNDISFRAVEILRHVSVVASEDTRVTGRLLAKFGIRVPLVSLHEHNEERRVPQILARLEAGEDVALVSDAGTPLISDPGYRMVHEAAEMGFRIVPVPGASAVMAALSVAGLPTDRFTFVGFLPKKRSKRVRELAELAGLGQTLVMFESPHRLLRTLKDMEGLMGDRTVVLCRELTKQHEEIIRGTPATLMESLESRKIRGEITLVVAGRPDLGHEME